MVLDEREKSLIEVRLRTIVRNNFDSALKASLRKVTEIVHANRTSGIWVRRAKEAVQEAASNAIVTSIETADRDVSFELRGDPQEFWDQMRLYSRERLFSFLSSVQASISSQYGRLIAGGHINSTFRDANIELEHLITKEIGERIQRDKLTLVANQRAAKEQQVRTEHPKGGLLKDRQFDYVDANRISQLKAMKEFDSTKLVQLCEELNSSFKSGGLIGPVMLLRSILDHVPPIFGLNNFSEVANNYSNGTRSFRESMRSLDTSSRKIADSHLHTQIRKSEVLPTVNQINFSHDLDVLLGEIVRVACQ